MNDDDNSEETIPRLPRPDTKEIASRPLSQPLEEPQGERWDSTNLIHASTQHLYGLMLNLNGDEPQNVLVACDVAKAIQNLMRLQLDAFKVRKGIK